MVIDIDVQETPNPRARRFLLDHAVQQGAIGRSHAAGDAVEEPLVRAVLDVPGVVAVLTLPRSITVTRADDADWAALAPEVVRAMREALAGG